MPVERVDYYSDDEYEYALAQEYEESRQQEEPDVVPCFRCLCQMYQECSHPQGNICSECERFACKIICKDFVGVCAHEECKYPPPKDEVKENA